MGGRATGREEISVTGEMHGVAVTHTFIHKVHPRILCRKIELKKGDDPKKRISTSWSLDSDSGEEQGCGEGEWVWGNVVSVNLRPINPLGYIRNR